MNALRSFQSREDDFSIGATSNSCDALSLTLALSRWEREPFSPASWTSGSVSGLFTEDWLFAQRGLRSPLSQRERAGVRENGLFRRARPISLERL